MCGWESVLKTTTKEIERLEVALRHADRLMARELKDYGRIMASTARKRNKVAHRYSLLAGELIEDIDESD
jgi:hypothetical protein